MAQSKKTTEETYGMDAKSPKVSKGSIVTMGHSAIEGAIPDRGTSPNTKTGYPANASK
jgi:hypothetical protein